MEIDEDLASVLLSLDQYRRSRMKKMETGKPKNGPMLSLASTSVPIFATIAAPTPYPSGAPLITSCSAKTAIGTPTNEEDRDGETQEPADALSCKHLHSQICDNCGADPISVRCSTDNLVLCQDCNWDTHGSCSVSTAHDRNPVEGFSGYPSAWGFDLEDRKPQQSIPNWTYQDSDMSINVPLLDSWMSKSTTGVALQDLMVPNENALICSNGSCGEKIAVSKRQDPSCEKQ
ncbi:hypothetical protein F0562_034208 [Nyssa sinensis]|uniref:B box-type domain-containing protein n=1 Tax=Nyssa sinensis TaxID=561372 RepID=A0A5J5AFC7_9ASTE|nr:hypothetical protein F0562_034208 [Nyssa sinensis]